MRTNFLLRAILPLLILLLYQIKLFSYTTVSGSVSGTWTAGTYYVSNHITIQDNTTLTIEPGCVIKFATKELIIYGTLNAIGTSGSNIVFTSMNDNSVGDIIAGSTGAPLKGDWFGIQLYGSADYDGVGYFDYCRISYGGNYGSAYDANIYFHETDAGYFKNSLSEYSDEDGVKLLSSNPIINNSTISYNDRHGIFGEAGYMDANTATITNNTFTNNGQYAVNISNVRIQSYSGNAGSGNGTNGFGIKGEVKDNVTWTCGSSTFPFVLIGLVTVIDGVTLTISPGTIIKGLPSGNGELYVIGTLDVNGIEGSNVVFTSIKDDTYGGDTNNDGSATSPTPGDWYGIHLYGNATNDGIGYFDFCRVRYGGNYGSSYDANIYFDLTDAGHFQNSISEYSYEDGMELYSANPIINNSTISNNNRHGIFGETGYMDANTATITNNTFNNNGQYAVNISNVRIQTYSGNTGSGNGTNGFGIKGEVKDNATWTCGSNTFPFVLIGLVTVTDGVTLTISPGTIIKGVPSGNGELYVIGTLDINGTEGSNVVFTSIKDDTYGGDTNNDGTATSPTPGDWYGIHLYGNETNDGIGYFDYCRVRYGGNYGSSYDANIYFDLTDAGHFQNSISEYSYEDGMELYSANPIINNSTISNNNRHGIFGETGYMDANTATITNNTFNNNGQYAVNISNVRIQTYSGNTGSGNGTNGFGIKGEVKDNATWTCGSSTFPFVLIGQVIVNDNMKLTLSQGTIVKGVSNGELYVKGTLDVNGIDGSNVVFTSIKDDSYGGDSNNDGSLTQPAPGDWYGINVEGSSSGNDGLGNFDYCRIRYGGSVYTNYDANIFFSEGGWNGCTFANSICEYSKSDGIRIYNCCPQITNSTISNNLRHGVYAYIGYRPATAPYINYCTFNNNGEYGAYLADVRPTSYTGNSGSGNGTNELGVYGVIEDTPINWSSGSTTFPISLINNLTINSEKVLTITGGTFKCKTYYTTSLGSFYLNDDATIEIGSPDGIASSGSTGNIRNNGTRSFSSNANYVYNGTAAQVTGTGLPSTVKSIKVNNSAGVSLTSNLLVNGTLYLANGQLNNTSKGTVTIANNGIVIKETGTLANPVTYSGTVNLEYKGATAVTTGSELPSTDIINNFSVENTGGVTLNRDVKVNGTLNLVSGTVTTGGNVLTLGSGTGNLGTLTRTSGKIIGNFKRWFAAATVSNVIFPLGTADYYIPANITFPTTAPSTGGTITAYFTASNPGIAGLPLTDSGANITKTSPDGFWTLTTADGLTGGTYNIDLNAEGFTGITSFSYLHMLKRTDEGSNWFISGTHSPCTGSNSCPVVHRTGLETFSQFGIGSTDDNPLPVELLSFTARAERNSITLNWTTGTEINNHGFDVERSSAEKEKKWVKTGFVNGKGNSNTETRYTFVDKGVNPGLYSFRLKQIDYNGNFRYFELGNDVNSAIPDEYELGQNYPNPFNPTTKINYSLPTDGFVTIKMFDVTGREIQTIVNEIKQAGYYTAEFNSFGIASGTYFYCLKTKDFYQVKKMVVLR